MREILSIDYERYPSIDDLSAEDIELVREAEEATKSANARYSNFHVGAAVRLQSGRRLHASNFESEVYPAGLCAERSLLFYIEANFGDDPVVALAIASDPSERECYPCGQCRQVIVDVERRQKSPIRVIMTGAGSATVVDSAEKLLPFTFKL
jgi:cytidine deaminase